MQLLTAPNADLKDVTCLVIDIDDFLWAQTSFGDREPEEIEGVARHLGMDPQALRDRWPQRREQLRARFQRPISIYEVLLSFGIDGAKLDALRQAIYRPADHIKKPDQEISQLIAALATGYRLAFGTNSPVATGEEILKLLGIREVVGQKQAPVWGYSNLITCFKPNPIFFSQIARSMEWDPGRCVSLGNSVNSDGHAAIAGGFAGALILPEGRDQFLALGQHVVRGEWDQLRTLCGSK